jgi:hypothetical protein
MKTKAIFAVLLTFGALAFAESREKSKFEVSVGGSLGWLLSGGQKDLIGDTVTPNPDSYLVMDLNLQAAYFPLEFLGAEAGTNFLGSTTATSSDTSDSLGTYKFSNYYLGLNLRKFLDDKNDSCVSLGAGVNYTVLKYHDDYKDLFGSGFEFYDIQPKLGFYAKIAFNYYFSRNWFLAANVQYMKTNAYIDESDYTLDGNNLLMGAAIGFAL